MENNFKTITGFKSYVNKPEITNLSPQFLVKGSKNVLIDYGNRIISRNGYTLFGSAASSNSTGIKSSYEWDTSTAKQFPIRAWGQIIEFYWNSTWNTLKSNLATPYLEFAKIWDNTEKIDVILWVMGDTNTYKWSGGVSKIASSTSTTVTKQGVLSNKTTIAFVAGTPGTVAPTITDSANGFVTAGFAAGDILYITGSPLNSRNFTIGSVIAGIITLIMTDVLVSESAGASITVHNGEPTWSSARFLTTNKTIGNPTISNATPAVISLSAHGLNIGQQISFSTSGALPTGLNVGQIYYIISAGFGANSFEVSATLNGAAINTSSGGSGTHTLYAYTRQITYLGNNYVYTGGESTDTLTGLTSFPVATPGDPVWQTSITLFNPTSIPSSFKQDLIGVQLNQLILGSTKSQEVYGSLNSDYTNFTLTSPRVPADPFKVTMDNYCTCIVPIDNQAQTTSSLMFGAGTNEFFQLSYQLSQDNANELVRMVKLKTAAGSGLISKGAIGNIKNSVAYISREPALDLLSNVENNNVPISDPIKNDFDTYNFTGAHVKYWKRSIYIAIPSSGIVLIYDLMRKLWQPPQTMPIGRLAIIGDWLYGHSSISNETYKLFIGTNDNGNQISQIARFAYNNGGKRDRLKNLSEFWSDGYITPNAELIHTALYGFEGILGNKSFSILGGDNSVTNPIGGSPLGDESLGNNPLGGDNLDPLTGLPGTNSTLVRFYQVDTANLLDYPEYFMEYKMNTLDGQFALVGYGSNQVDAATSMVTHTK